MDKIEKKLNIFYDDKEKKFTHLFYLSLKDHCRLEEGEEIFDYIANYMKSNNIKNFSELLHDENISFVSTNSKNYDDLLKNCEDKYSGYIDYENFMNRDVTDIDEKVEEESKKLVLADKNPYDGDEVENLDKNKWKKFAIGSAAVITAMAIAVGAYVMGGRGSKKETPVTPDETTTNIESYDEFIFDSEKIALESWEQYVADAAETNQKNYFMNMMNEIEDNIVDIKFGEKEYKVSLSPEEKLALDMYYNTYDMSYDEMFDIYGAYTVEHDDLVKNVHSGLDKVRLSFVYAKDVKDIIHLNLVNQQVNDAFEKYAKLFVAFNNATSSKEKSSIKEDIENNLSVDFLENGSFDLLNEPSATVILQLVNSAANLNSDMGPLSSKLNVILEGTKTNIDVDGVKDSIDQNGMVDASCSAIDKHLEGYDEFIEDLSKKGDIIKSSNHILYVNAISNGISYEEYVASLEKSKLDVFYAENYKPEEVVELMNKYLENVKDADVVIDSEKFSEEVKKEQIKALQEKQSNNNKPYSAANPSGGKPGDVIKSETTENVKVTEAQVGAADIKKAQEDYLAKHPELNPSSEQIEKAAVDETARREKSYNSGNQDGREGRGPQSNDQWYMQGYNQGKAVYDEVQKSNQNPTSNTTPTNAGDYTPNVGDQVNINGENKGTYAGTHQQNPNQQGQNRGNDVSSEVEVIQYSNQTNTDNVTYTVDPSSIIGGITTNGNGAVSMEDLANDIVNDMAEPVEENSNGMSK